MNEKVLAELIDFKLMPTAASYQFLTDQLKRMKDTAAVVKALETPLDTLTKALSVFDVELKRSAKNLITDKIREADTQMDHAYTGVKVVVHAMTLYPPTETIGEAVTRVWQKFKDYKIDVQMDMNAEMGLMTNLCKDLKSAPIATDIETLGLTQWVNTLNDKYNALHTLMLDRTSERALANPRTLSKARLDAEAQYRNVIQLLNAHILLEGDDAYKNCVALLNAEVDHYNQTVIARRKGRKSAEDEMPATEGSDGDSEGTIGN